MTKEELIAELAEHGVEANMSATKAELEEKLSVVTGTAEVVPPPDEGSGTAGPAAELEGHDPEPEVTDRIERGAKALHELANPDGKPWYQLQSAVKDRYIGLVAGILEATDE